MTVLCSGPVVAMAHILIVEDFVETGQAIQRLLQRHGHRVAHVETGEAALSYCDGADLPDLIILDERMPGMAGLEVLQRLKSNPMTAQIGVVMYSAVGSDTFEDEALDAGAIEC